MKSERSRLRAANCRKLLKRLRLLVGDKCCVKGCKSRRGLSTDHVFPRLESQLPGRKQRSLNWESRLYLYLREHAEGIALQTMCMKHNRKKGRK